MDQSCNKGTKRLIVIPQDQLGGWRMLLDNQILQEEDPNNARLLWGSNTS